MNIRNLLVWNNRTLLWCHRNTQQTMKHKSNLEYYLMLKKRSSPQQLMLGAMLCLPATNRKAKQKWKANTHSEVVRASILMVVPQLLSSAMWHGVTSYKHINILPSASSDVMWFNNSCRETTLPQWHVTRFWSTCLEYQNESTLNARNFTFLFNSRSN